MSLKSNLPQFPKIESSLTWLGREERRRRRNKRRRHRREIKEYQIEDQC
jgi:hypothetical protein